jgi:site-specific DNA-adenine methylase
VKRYGIPYKGSKNSIARKIVSFLPPADVLIDICAGGCAITHAALEICEGLAPKWERIIANDICEMPLKLFKDAICGEYADEKRWIDRETFQKLKDVDPYVRYCWSFGNNGTNYLYAQQVEPWKKALHYARVLGDTSLLRNMGIDGDGSRADVLAHEAEYKDKYIRWWLSRQEYAPAELDELIKNVKADIERGEEELRAYLLKALKTSGLTQAEVQRRLGTQMAGHYFGRSQWEFPTREMYQRMQEFMPLPDDYNELVGLYRLRQSLESLQRLQSLESLQSLQISFESYENVKIPENSVIYTDIPYQGTDCGSYEGFDHESFFNWAAGQKTPVFISSYKVEDERFTCVFECDKRSLNSGKGSGKLMKERIYANTAGVERGGSR